MKQAAVKKRYLCLCFPALRSARMTLPALADIYTNTPRNDL